MRSGRLTAAMAVAEGGEFLSALPIVVVSVCYSYSEMDVFFC